MENPKVISLMNSNSNMSSNFHSQILLGIKIRVFEQMLLELYGRGGIRGTIHTSLGQELNAVVLTKALNSNDMVFGTHRSHAYFLSLTQDFEGLAREIYGRRDGVSRGIGGSQHLLSKQLLTNGIQGGLSPIATGWSYDSANLSSVNQDSRAFCIVGDGTLGTGIFYESLNCASLFQSRTFFVIENNKIAQSTPQEQFLSGSIEKRAEAFGIPYFFVDANNENSLFVDFPKFIETAKTGPAIININCFRLGPHSKGDDNRPDSEIESMKSSDLLSNLILGDTELLNYQKICREEFMAMFERVKQEPPSHNLAENYLEVFEVFTTKSSKVGSLLESTNLRELTSLRINNAFDSYDTLLYFGEDIQPSSIDHTKPYGGAFGVSKMISERHLPRMINFPISEAALVGFGIGRAIKGFPTIIEIMFGDFSTLIVDQIVQQASKIPSMYGVQVKIPLLIRIPSGGRRGYGPTHSQSLETLFLGFPNIAICVASSLEIDTELYSKLLSTGIPTLAIEPKDLYTLTFPNRTMLGYDFVDSRENLVMPFRFSPQVVPKATLFTYGYSFELCRQAIEKLLIESEFTLDVFIARTLSPIDLSSLVESLNSTGKLIIVEETDSKLGVGAFILEQIQYLVRRPISILFLGGKGIIGASEASESSALLNTQLIFQKIDAFGRE